MKEKFRAYLPIWFVLMVPPLLILLLGWHFILCGIGLMCGLLIAGLPDGFIRYSKNIFKLWGISILLDVLSFILIFATELLSGDEFFKTNLVYPIEHNPYSKALSAVYMILIFLIMIFIGYKLVRRFVTKGIKTSKIKMITLHFAIVISILPYLLFVPSSLVIKAEKNNIEDFQGTLMGNKSDIVTIMKYLSVSDYIDSYVLDTHAEPYSINLYLKQIDINYIKMFEMDAATIFNIVEDVNEVTYTMNGIRYSYTINKINKIYGNIKKDTLEEIANRYSKSMFTDYIYLDHVGDYDLFDESEACEENVVELFTYAGNIYYLECSTLENIYLYYNNEKVMNLKEAIERDTLTEIDIINSLLPIINDRQLNENSSN